MRKHMFKRNLERGLNRRDFLTAAGAGFVSFSLAGCLSEPQNISGRNISGRLTNFIVIFCDDLGYGDIGCFGSKKHRTPNVDRMAREGMRFTSFYVSSGVCTPSRSSLMTGCYPRRV
ncbi:MAG: sulfatase-like hydrolase/transferase, partial [Planctomycetota bacterium]